MQTLLNCTGISKPASAELATASCKQRRAPSHLRAALLPPRRPESEPEANGTKDAAGQRPVWTGRGPALAGLPGASALSPAGRRRFPPRRRGCRAASAPSWGDVHRAPAAVTGPGGHSLDGRPWPWGLVLPPPQGLAGPPLCTQGPLLCGRRSRTAGRDFSLSAADRGLFSGHTTSESVRTSVQGEAQLYLPVGAHTRACVMYTCTCLRHVKHTRMCTHVDVAHRPPASCLGSSTSGVWTKLCAVCG